jgi:hypothetical protein
VARPSESHTVASTAEDSSAIAGAVEA